MPGMLSLMVLQRVGHILRTEQPPEKCIFTYTLLQIELSQLTFIFSSESQLCVMLKHFIEENNSIFL